MLKKTKRIIKSTIVTGAALGLTFAPTAALAHGGSSSQSGSGGSSRQAQQDKNRRGFNDWFQRNKDRQKLTCTQRQDALNKQADAYKAQAQKRLTGMNIVYSGVQTYVSGGGIAVGNYDTMNAQVTAGQTAATDAVNAVSAPQLNCGDDNAAAAVSDDNKTFKHDHDAMNGSIGAAQKALNAYRKDLNQLFEAVING